MAMTTLALSPVLVLKNCVWTILAFPWAQLKKECMRVSGVDKTNVHEIVLVGGSTRIPKVQAMINEFSTEKYRGITILFSFQFCLHGVSIRSFSCDWCGALELRIFSVTEVAHHTRSML